jgi:hypothetical protein
MPDAFVSKPALEAKVKAAVETESRAVDEVLRCEESVDGTLAWSIDDDALYLSDLVVRFALRLRCKDEARRARKNGRYIRLGPVLEKDCPLMCAEHLGLIGREILARRLGSDEAIKLRAPRVEVDCALCRKSMVAENREGGVRAERQHVCQKQGHGVR